MRFGASPLEQSPFGQAHGIRPGHNDMVEHSDTHKRQRVLELPRKRFVGTRWLSDTRGVIMRKDHGGSVAFQCGLDHLSRVDRRAINRPEKQLLKRYNAVAVVEEQAAEHFSFQISQLKREIELCLVRVLGVPLRRIRVSRMFDARLRMVALRTNT